MNIKYHIHIVLHIVLQCKYRKSFYRYEGKRFITFLIRISLLKEFLLRKRVTTVFCSTHVSS